MRSYPSAIDLDHCSVPWVGLEIVRRDTIGCTVFSICIILYVILFDRCDCLRAIFLLQVSMSHDPFLQYIVVQLLLELFMRYDRNNGSDLGVQEVESLAACYPNYCRIVMRQKLRYIHMDRRIAHHSDWAV